jgi:hypothetical protein
MGLNEKKGKKPPTASASSVMNKTISGFSLAIVKEKNIHPQKYSINGSFFTKLFPRKGIRMILEVRVLSISA